MDDDDQGERVNQELRRIAAMHEWFRVQVEQFHNGKNVAVRSDASP
jgi:hypothetical protein